MAAARTTIRSSTGAGGAATMTGVSGNAGRADDPGSTRRHAGVDAWERFQWIWNAAFFALLGASTVFALVDADLSWTRRAGFALLAAVLAGWYWVFVATGRAWWGRRGSALIYYLGFVAAFDALSTLHPAAMLLSAPLYWQLYSFWPVRWSIPGSAAITLLLWVLGSWHAGESLAPTAAQWGTFVVLVAVSGLLAAFINAIIRQSEERRRLIAELEAAQAGLAAAEREAGIIQERQRLAGEIHDTLAQGFTSIVMNLEAAEAALPSDLPAVGRRLDRARQTARDSLTEARRLVWALRPEPLEGATLPEALARLAARWAETSGLAATVAVTGAPRPLHPEVEVTLLRAAQEALANARKHACARRLTLTLSYMDDLVALDVQDDGAGFDPAANGAAPTNGHGGGFGLPAMRERVERLGGTLAVESAPGAGTTVAVALPALVAPASVGERDGNG